MWKPEHRATADRRGLRYEKAGREASPTTAIIDSQTAKGAVKGGLRSTRPATTPARRWSAASATS